MSQWENTYDHDDEGNVIHIELMPLDDAAEHEEGMYCACEPQMEYTEGVPFVIHNSFDGREAVEWAEKILED